MPGTPAPNLVLIQSGQAFGGLEGLLDTPALTRPRRPACVAAPGAGCSSAGRPVPRWHRCGGSANGGHRYRCRLRPAGETRPRSTGVGRGLRHRRSVSARRVPGSARAAHRRGSGRHRWARAGWPPPPARSPARDRARRRAAGGRRRRLHRRPPRPREPSACTARSINAGAKAGLVAKPLRPWGFRRRRSDQDRRTRLRADTGPGRSARVRGVRRRSDTPRPGSSRYARPCREY